LNLEKNADHHYLLNSELDDVIVIGFHTLIRSANDVTRSKKYAKRLIQHNLDF